MRNLSKYLKSNAILALGGMLFAMSCAADRSGAKRIGPDPILEATLEPSVIHLADASAARPKAGSLAEIRHLARGQNAYLGHLVLGPDMKVPLHRDATEEYLYILSGGGTLYVDGTRYELRAGHAVLMPANAEVHFENGPEELRAIQVFAGPSPAKKYDAWVPENR